MGYFDTVQPLATAPAPLTDDRVLEALNRLELNPELDEAGTAVVHFAQGYLYYTLTELPTGCLFSVRGSYRGTFPLDMAGPLAEFTNYWNQQNLFPKVLVHAVREGDQGGFLVLPTELSMVYAGGVTNNQLEEHLKAAVQTSLEYFDAVAAAFGDEGE
ncbi:YbjN domain-containing protein [Rothia nasimurium]|uniref:YbjN domain-containing protein n=1 Tax=Rothia nasimurium TaxID=85336 RepID=UPI001F254825|nr:YbjN domain-containing protein [Rothia nasimurium]